MTTLWILSEVVSGMNVNNLAVLMCFASSNKSVLGAPMSQTGVGRLATPIVKMIIVLNAHVYKQLHSRNEIPSLQFPYYIYYG